MKKLLITLIALAGLRVQAQDPHFTQYFASPLSLNPANTGFIDGAYRVSANLRQQWWNVGESYKTGSASFDMNLLSENTAVNNRLGVGVMAIREETLRGILKSTYVAASAAYHKQLSEDNTHNLGIGVQAAFSDKRLDHSRLSFASQFTGDGFDTAIPIDMISTANTARFFDVNIGLLYSSFRPWGSYYGGLSVYHLTRPNESLFSAAAERLAMRRTIHGGTSIDLAPTVGLIFTGLFMQQGETSDILAGGAVSFGGTGEGKLYLGIWHRLSDSVIPYLGYDFKNLSVGLNYGMTIPDVNSYRPRTMELSIIFRKAPTSRLALCPRF